MNTTQTGKVSSGDMKLNTQDENLRLSVQGKLQPFCSSE